MSRDGHPLPASDEARGDEIPEGLERRKGHGDDLGKPVQLPGDPVAPDGASYPIERDRTSHQDRGQSFIDDPDRG